MSCEPDQEREYLLVSGIAKPDQLRAVVKRAGLRVVEELYFPDHHRLSGADAQQIRKALANLRNGALLVTEKDWGRWRDLFTVPGLVICVRFAFLGNGAAELERFLGEVAKGAGCSTLP
jgi:tetraacyldisaccharide-1-P 4'-kinase